MTHRPRHPKPDSNQAEIVRELRRCGLVVHDVSSLGGDCLDLFVGDPVSGVWCQVEVKTDDGELTAEEALYIHEWADVLPVVLARSADDVLRRLGRVK